MKTCVFTSDIIYNQFPDQEKYEKSILFFIREGFQLTKEGFLLPRKSKEVMSEVPHPVASGATYEGRDRGVNPISVVAERDRHSKGCWRPVTSDSLADPEG